MTKERELLMRICRFLDSNVEYDFGFVSDIRYLLSQPSEEKLTMRQRLEEYKKGYAKAEQHLKREPLSDDWIKDNIHLIHQDVSFTGLVRSINQQDAVIKELITVLRGICNAYYNDDYDLCYSRIEDADEVLEKYEEDDAND